MNQTEANTKAVHPTQDVAPTEPKKRPTIPEISLALREHQGRLTIVAQYLKVTVSELQTRIRNSSRLQKEVREMELFWEDLAEKTLVLKAVEEEHLGALMFFLKLRDKKFSQVPDYEEGPELPEILNLISNARKPGRITNAHYEEVDIAETPERRFKEELEGSEA